MLKFEDLLFKSVIKTTRFPNLHPKPEPEPQRILLLELI